jgi:hypothetical protein
MSEPEGIPGCKHPKRLKSKFDQCYPPDPDNPGPAADCLVAWGKVWSEWIPVEIAAVSRQLRTLTDKRKIGKVADALTDWAEQQEKSACKLLNELEKLLPPSTRDVKEKEPGTTDPTQPPPPPFRKSL